jgi:hypothetical protein
LAGAGLCAGITTGSKNSSNRNLKNTEHNKTMADKIIQHRDGTATLVSDTYSFGLAVGGTPSVPELDHAAERAADPIRRGQMRLLFPCTDSQFARILEMQEYPQPIGRTTPTWSGRSEPIWSRREINEFISRWRAIVACLPEKV